MERLALPAPGAQPRAGQAEMLRTIHSSICSVLNPQSAPARPAPLLATIAIAVLTRIESRPRLHAGLQRALHAVRRVRALAA